MGLAFGFDPRELGLHKLCVSADPLLQKLDGLRREEALAEAKAKAAEGGNA